MKEGAKPYNEVAPIALELWNQLKPLCNPKQCKIAGSIRRKEELIGDIEIVCTPLEAVVKDMFGQDTNKKIKPLYNHLNKAINTEEKLKGGERYRQFMYKGIKVDLFMVSSEEFGRTLAIRTGPSEYSHKVIASAWRKLGWVGTPDGLRKQFECENTSSDENKPKWKCIVSNPQKPPAFHTEELFFEFLRMSYISPEMRGKIKQAA